MIRSWVVLCYTTMDISMYINVNLYPSSGYEGMMFNDLNFYLKKYFGRLLIWLANYLIKKLDFVFSLRIYRACVISCVYWHSIVKYY